MNPSITYGSTADLAVSGAGLFGMALVAGLAVVALLLGAFWWGGRLRERRAAPPLPSEQPARPARPTHAEGEVTPADSFPADGERLTPHQLGGHGGLGGHGDEARRPSGGGRSGRGGRSDGTPGT
ncbi:DUF6479 family protein [Streptomyces sp. NPDC002018]|uniref:DUF6479 family protein n=1 Tax=Streptomyces sp. NPDC002018 TaxID=3364629 RepID=UPI0036872F8E